jgi:hypothetical protein
VVAGGELDDDWLVTEPLRAGRIVRWLTPGSTGNDDGVDIADEIDKRRHENAAPISDRISASGRPVLRATERATGLATSLVQPVRPTWPIATKFHFDI